MGLTIAKSLAEAMGGSLTAQAVSKTGQDSEKDSASKDADSAETTIRFVLTLTAAAPQPAYSQAESHS